MPRILMTETYVCGAGNFARGKHYEVTDARARMLTGRGSAVAAPQSKGTAPAAAAAGELHDGDDGPGEDEPDEEAHGGGGAGEGQIPVAGDIAAQSVKTPRAKKPKPAKE